MTLIVLRYFSLLCVHAPFVGINLQNWGSPPPTLQAIKKGWDIQLPEEGFFPLLDEQGLNMHLQQEMQVHMHEWNVNEINDKCKGMKV